jgi:hypothetical protein
MWNSALDALDRGTAAVFDETCCMLWPKRRGLGPNSGITADSKRGAFEFMASVEAMSERQALEGSGYRDLPAANGRHLNLVKILSAHGADWPWRPKKGDIVQVGETSFSVLEDFLDGTGRILLYLGAAS